jgi:hypothetical protein
MSQTDTRSVEKLLEEAKIYQIINPRIVQAPPTLSAQDRVSLCEALDRVLNKGAVVAGELTISVADIELIYLGLQVVITSIEKARSLAAISAPTVPEAADGHR